MSTSNAHIAKTVTLTGSYSPLSSVSLIGDFEVTSVSTNGDSYIQDSDGSGDVLWKAGEKHFFKRVDLATLFMKGNTHVITIIGNRTDQVRG